MARFIVRRIVQSIFLLFGISVLSYAMMRAAPGGPESYFDDPKIPPSTRELLREQFGLNEPVPVQYLKWLSNAARLNFGYSFIDRRPVIEKILERLWHLILPATIGAMGGWIVFSRYLRSEVLEVLGQDFVRTARAKGVRERLVMSRHVLRNALIPVVTIMGGTLATLVSGSVLFENTFSWPGIGRMAVAAAFQRDYPVLMALTMLTAFLVIAGNLMADIAYGWVDPRVRYE